MIAVFTKNDQFLRNVGIDLEDQNHEDPCIDASKEAKERAANEIFEEHYLGPLGEDVPWVRLRGKFRVECPGNVLMFFDSYEPASGTL